MKLFRSAGSALCAVLVFAAASGAAQAQSAPRALSPWDAQLYAAAFDAVRKGDFEAARAKLAQVQDKSLVGHVEFQKLFHPTAYKASYEELVAWLDQYGDLPGAARVRTLAEKRKPTPETATADPAVLLAKDEKDPIGALTAPAQRLWSSVTDAAKKLVDVTPAAQNPKAAREALNAGDLKTAHKLAVELGDRWVAGLAAYRMKDYAEALRRFESVAVDPTEDPWVRAGGAYWAARSAIAKGSPEQAPEFLRVAARYPHTFYGQIAERQLGLEPSIAAGPKPYDQLNGAIVKAATAGPTLDTASVQAFVKATPRAKRAVALAQLGLRAEAGQELRAGLTEAASDQARADWTNLAIALGPILTGPERAGVDPADYPMPELSPAGGFTVDKALVYALVRKESRFEPTAVSSVGAYGLMQVMPTTGAWLMDDDKLKKEPKRLHDPATNLKVGQEYVNYLLRSNVIEGDILRMAAAYNGGPGPVMKAVKQLGPEADALLIIESVPVPQSRQYVEEVISAYWIYRKLMGLDVKSLDAVVSGARVVAADAPAAPALNPVVQQTSAAAMP